MQYKKLWHQIKHIVLSVGFSRLGKQTVVKACKRFSFDLGHCINEMCYRNIYQNRWVKNIPGKLLSVV